MTKQYRSRSLESGGAHDSIRTTGGSRRRPVTHMGYSQDLRRRVRRPRQGTGNCRKVADNPWSTSSKSCPHWKAQLNILRPKARKETQRGEDRYNLQDPGPPRRCEVQPAGSGHPLHHRFGEASSDHGWGRRTESGVGATTPRAQRMSRGEEVGGRGTGRVG